MSDLTWFTQVPRQQDMKQNVRSGGPIAAAVACINEMYRYMFAKVHVRQLACGVHGDADPMHTYDLKYFRTRLFGFSW